MKKTDRITVISNMVVFTVIVGLKYLYRLEYQRGYLDGVNNVKSNIPDGTARYMKYPDAYDQTHAFTDVLSKTRGVI